MALVALMALMLGSFAGLLIGRWAAVLPFAAAIPAAGLLGGPELGAVGALAAAGLLAGVHLHRVVAGAVRAALARQVRPRRSSVTARPSSSRTRARSAKRRPGRTPIGFTRRRNGACASRANERRRTVNLTISIALVSAPRTAVTKRHCRRRTCRRSAGRSRQVRPAQVRRTASRAAKRALSAGGLRPGVQARQLVRVATRGRTARPRRRCARRTSSGSCAARSNVSPCGVAALDQQLPAPLHAWVARAGRAASGRPRPARAWRRRRRGSWAPGRRWSRVAWRSRPRGTPGPRISSGRWIEGS